MRTEVTAYRDQVASWMRTLGVNPKLIGDTLGGPVASAAGTPVGKEPLTGAAFGQAIAANA